MATASKPVKAFPAGDYDGESDKSYDPADDDYFEIIQDERQPCFLSHSTRAYLTFHDADGNIIEDPDNSDPIDFIDEDVHPRLDFNFNGRMTDPANARTPLMTDCIMLGFFGVRPGSQRWGGRLQVICRRAFQEDERTSVWLRYNGLQNREAGALEQRYHTPRDFFFTRRLADFRHQMTNRAGGASNARYRERVYMSIEGCRMTIIGEASVQTISTGEIVRTTRIHEIDCCHTPDEFL